MGSGAVMRSSCLTMTLCCGGSVAVTWKAVRRELAREENGRSRPRPRMTTLAPVISHAPVISLAKLLRPSGWPELLDRSPAGGAD